MTLAEARQLFEDIAVELRLPADWSFRFDKAVRRFGSCQYRTKTITLSAKLVELNDFEAVNDTIRHEIAPCVRGLEGWTWTAVEDVGRPLQGEADSLL